MSFNINNKFIFIDSFQFLSSSLDSLLRNLIKDADEELKRTLSIWVRNVRVTY